MIRTFAPCDHVEPYPLPAERMPTFQADLHSHVDYDPSRNYWHGERPDVLAKRIVQGTQLDVIAITEHNSVSDRYFDVAEEVERLLEDESARLGTRRKISILLGAELTVTFDRIRYHVGYVYRDRFARGDLPAVPNLRCSAQDLEHFTIDYPGIRVLNHPTWKDRGSGGNPAVTREFIGSGLIDGVEIVNGCMIYNGKDESVATRDAGRMFLEARTGSGGIPRPRLAAIGSSDAHRAAVMGSVATAFDGEDHDALFDEVCAGRTKAVGIEPTRVTSRLAQVRAAVAGLDGFVRLAGEPLDMHSLRTE